MSNIVKDISSIEIETLDNIRSSKSANTIRAYKSDFNHFIKCVEKMSHIINSNINNFNKITSNFYVSTLVLEKLNFNG